MRHIQIERQLFMNQPNPAINNKSTRRNGCGSHLYWGKGEGLHRWSRRNGQTRRLQEKKNQIYFILQLCFWTLELIVYFLYQFEIEINIKWSRHYPIGLNNRTHRMVLNDIRHINRGAYIIKIRHHWPGLRQWFNVENKQPWNKNNKQTEWMTKRQPKWGLRVNQR